MNRDECRVEILRLYQKHSPHCTWEAVGYPRIWMWLLREGAR
jgi:hypothetical protein